MNTLYIRLRLKDREEISGGIWAGEPSRNRKRLNRPTSSIQEVNECAEYNGVIGPKSPKTIR